MLKIENLTKRYGEKIAVNNLSLHIAPGEIYGFIGHNGAGKTSTLKCIVGIQDFDEGEIYIDSKSIKKQPIECKKLFAYIPDNPDIYDFMTGVQYLNFVADIFEVSQQERSELIKKYADMFEISGSLNDAINSYSHGMKQKLVIISALIHSPKLIIMDEPFSALDALQFESELKKVLALPSSVIITLHRQNQALKYFDQIWEIKDGELTIVKS